jgi:hypothetical protein
MTTRKLPDALPLQIRREMFGRTVDQDARTVTLVFTTGATVRRQRYTGWDAAVPFDEVLVVSKKAVNLSRLNAGAPVVDSHAVGTTLAQVAVVERAWIEGQEGKATVRFPASGIDEWADRMFAMVADGIIKNISVGYSIDSLTIEQPKGKGEVERHIATRWTPHEISFVTVGADPGAQVRTAGEASYPVEITSLMPSAIAARMRMRMASIGL